MSRTMLPIGQSSAEANTTEGDASILRWRPDKLVGVSVFVIGTLVAWFRLTPVTRATMWAEDGHQFISDALSGGGVATVFRPYAGYMQFVPRIAAGLIVHVVSVDRFAVAMTAAGCLVAGLCAAVVYVCSADVTPCLPARIAFASITVVAPVLPVEVMGNMANVHAFFLWAAPWLLLYRPRTRRGATGLAAFAVAAALTEIQILLLLPLFFWQWRDRRRWPVRISLGVGLLAQLALTMSTPRPRPTGQAPGITDIGKGYFANAVQTAWAASGRVVRVAPQRALVLALLTLLLVAVATYISVVFGTATIRLVAVVLPAFSVAVWSAGVSLNHNNSVFPRGPGSGSYVLLRYGAVPSMCLIASIVLAVATPWPRKRLRQVCAGAVAIALAVTALASFVPQGTRRALGPVWSTEAADARKSCDGAPPTTVQKIATAPAGWTVKLSCGVLRR